MNAPKVITVGRRITHSLTLGNRHLYILDMKDLSAFLFPCRRARGAAAAWSGDSSLGGGGEGAVLLASSRWRFTFSNCTVKPCAAIAAFCSSHTPNLGTADGLGRRGSGGGGW